MVKFTVKSCSFSNYQQWNRVGKFEDLLWLRNCWVGSPYSEPFPSALELKHVDIVNYCSSCSLQHTVIEFNKIVSNEVSPSFVMMCKINGLNFCSAVKRHIFSFLPWVVLGRIQKCWARVSFILADPAMVGAGQTGNAGLLADSQNKFGLWFFA